MRLGNLAEKPNSKMVVVGRNDYSPEMTTELMKYCHAHGIADRVIFTGGVSRDEVLGWLKIVIFM